MQQGRHGAKAKHVSRNLSVSADLPQDAADVRGLHLVGRQQSVYKALQAAGRCRASEDTALSPR